MKGGIVCTQGVQSARRLLTHQIHLITFYMPWEFSFLVLFDTGKEDAYDAMIFDMNTEDDTQALTGPPICFLEEKVMHHVVKLLKPNGKFSERAASPYSDLEVLRIKLTAKYHLS